MEALHSERLSGEAGQSIDLDGSFVLDDLGGDSSNRLFRNLFGFLGSASSTAMSPTGTTTHGSNSKRFSPMVGV